MKKYITSLSSRNAAIIVGLAFVTSAIVVTFVDDFLLANFVIPGDTLSLAKDIEENRAVFHFAVLGYLLVLMLDSIISIALYVVLKAANTKLASLTAALRLVYAFTLVIGLLALVFRTIDVYSYASLKLSGYVFFALHIFILGYSIIKSGYMPKSLGILLVLASFTYAVFFVDLHLPQTLQMIIMLIMLLAELALSIWLILNRNKLPEINR